jgi:uncharacterized protein YciI
MYIADPTTPPTTVFMYTLHLTRPAMLTEGPTETEAIAGEEHWEYSQELLRKKVVIFAGRTMIRTKDAFAMVVIQVKSEAEARKIVENDPAVKQGVFQARIYPFQPMLVGEWPPPP